jgi:transposase
MGKRQKRYSPGFKEQAVGLLRSGRSLTEVSKELGVPVATLHRWDAQQEGREPPTLVETPDEELKRLRKEVERLRMERDFLKKATAFFAKESK